MDDILPNFRSTSDGWRAIIAESFTFDNLRKIVWAVGQYLKKENQDPINVVIGYDTRFMSDMFAKVVVETLSSQNIFTHLVPYPVPTPVISWMTYTQRFHIGLIITASHNPPHYNGLKIRMPYGGPPSSKTISEIESLLPVVTPIISESNIQCRHIDPLPAYIEKIRNAIDLDRINHASPVIAVDSMHGTTAGLLQQILSGTNAQVIQIRGNHDPLFGGGSPEPKSNTITPLIEGINYHKCNLGVAHDGDGDRIVAVDPKTGFLSPHDLIAVLAYDLGHRRNFPGSLVASVSTTRRVKAIAMLLGRTYREVPIGFRNSAKIMREETVLLAGEENGGIGLGCFMPERDGTLVAAMLVEILSNINHGIGQYVLNLNNIIGTSYFERHDKKIYGSPQESIEKILSNLPNEVCGIPVENVSTVDGVKLSLKNGSWVLLRAAGTEPLLRIYSEAESRHMCKELIKYINNLL